MNIADIAKQLKDENKSVVLIYAFNSTGKTRLSVEYKNLTKNKENGQHAGVYYNAFSEDLFIWDNDTDNGEQDILLEVNPSSLNKFHNLITEDAIRQKLIPYKPKFDFRFNIEKPEQGIDSISFFLEAHKDKPIKISRGEERIFVWCFFLALFEVEGWADKQDAHFFIDDPVSSLDDYNIFITASTIYDLIESHHEKRKIIIATHHIGLFSILADWLTKGEKSKRYEPITSLSILNRKEDKLSLEGPGGNVFLYHLHLLQTLTRADEEQLYTYHFALLRQVLENVSSFLGAGHFGYVLNQIGIEDTGEVARIITALSHKSVYYFQTELMSPDNVTFFRNIFGRLTNKYQFRL